MRPGKKKKIRVITPGVGTFSPNHEMNSLPQNWQGLQPQENARLRFLLEASRVWQVARIPRPTYSHLMRKYTLQHHTSIMHKADPLAFGTLRQARLRLPHQQSDPLPKVLVMTPIIGLCLHRCELRNQICCRDPFQHLQSTTLPHLQDLTQWRAGRRMSGPVPQN